MRILKLSFLMLSFNFLAQAQDTDKSTLSPIEVTGQIGNSSFEGFNTTEKRKRPFTVNTIHEHDLEKNGATQLNDITNLDASVTNSYNSIGYWDLLTVRGFTIDSRTSYYREGLPILGESVFSLENKERIEVLKGLSAIQSGVSAPGGLVNYIVKKPTQDSYRQLKRTIEENSSLTDSIDFSDRFGKASTWGYRVNLSKSELNPKVQNTVGSKSLAAIAIDNKPDNRNEYLVEYEWSNQTQPSQAGFSMHGTKIPSVPDPSLNLNNQPWTKPVVFDVQMGSLAWNHSLSSETKITTQLGFQKLKTDDRIAYPSMCLSESVMDRFCSDGRYNITDYRSDNEQRSNSSARVQLSSKKYWNETKHNLSAAISYQHQVERYGPRNEQIAGVGTPDGKTVVNENFNPTGISTNRDSNNIDLTLTDAIEHDNWGFWLGMRYSQFHRESIRGDGSRRTSYDDSVLLGFAGVSYDFKDALLYASYSEGGETFVTPNRTTYSNPGSYLKDVTSNQYELGLRAEKDQATYNLALFEIQRPVVTDKAPRYEVDGKSIHKGLEASIANNWNYWQIDSSFMLIEARREKSTIYPSYNGLKPVNVPEHTARIGLEHFWTESRHFSTGARIIHEGPREVTTDNTAGIPEWTRLDISAQYIPKLQSEKTHLLIRIGIENLADTRYWKESPQKYSHIFLFPGSERTARLSMHAQF